MANLTAREIEDALRGKKKPTEQDSNGLAKFVAQVERYVSGVLQEAPGKSSLAMWSRSTGGLSGLRKSFASCRTC